ncbi:MAG TPA: class I SAM-dependent methyltransferase [Gemmatimonadaceae bacterium]|jgi:SAM-dependent methyltransferase
MNVLDRYVRTGHKKVQGWIEPFSIRYIDQLAKLQHESGIEGSAIEIGVHHGRLFILLHLAGSRRRDLAIDVFADQHLNVDASGKGDRDQFIDNLRRWGGESSAVDIWQVSSLSITSSEILNRVGAATLFSVDGGHTEQCAYNDLKLADESLHEAGVVILDDFFNEFWPEVCLGATRYFQDPASRLRPFALTAGKMYLCRPERNAFYREKMRPRFSPWEYDKEITMFGSRVDILGMVEQREPVARKWRRSLAHTRVGTAVKAVVKRSRNGATAAAGSCDEISDAKTTVLASMILDWPPTPKRVLVVGCGTGREAGILARFLRSETIGIDIEQQFPFDVDGAQPARLMRMDAQSLSFTDASFDLVYSFHALEHIPDFRRALSEMNRVLAPGGIFCIGTPNRARLVGYLGSATSLTNKIRWNLHDLRHRFAGRWSNESGAHAGFYRRDLAAHCREAFGDATDVTDDYYARLYSRHSASLSVLRAIPPLKSAVFPCVYYIGRKPS